MHITPSPFPVRDPDCRIYREGAILVVDDEDYIRDLIGRILREQGFFVISASNGEEALTHLARQPISLILCNICMPRMNGPSFFDYVTQICPALSRRFVFCSGDIASEKSCAFLRSSGQPYLAKPFDLDELIGVVKRNASRPIILQKEQADQVLALISRLQRRRAPRAALASAGS